MICWMVLDGVGLDLLVLKENIDQYSLPVCRTRSSKTEVQTRRVAYLSLEPHYDGTPNHEASGAP